MGPWPAWGRSLPCGNRSWGPKGQGATEPGGEQGPQGSGGRPPARHRHRCGERATWEPESREWGEGGGCVHRKPQRLLREGILSWDCSRKFQPSQAVGKGGAHGGPALSPWLTASRGTSRITRYCRLGSSLYRCRSVSRSARSRRLLKRFTCGAGAGGHLPPWHPFPPTLSSPYLVWS